MLSSPMEAVTVSAGSRRLHSVGLSTERPRRRVCRRARAFWRFEDPLSPRTGDVDVQRAAVVALRGACTSISPSNLFGTDRLRVYEHALRPEGRAANMAVRSVRISSASR